MRRTLTFVNDLQDELEVWVEPWADLYVVARGTKVAFSYVTEGDDLLEIKLADGRLTFWFSAPEGPEVSINGTEAEPVDHYEWRARTRRSSSI